MKGIAMTELFSHGHALLIGVGNYKDTKISVPMTAQDAEDLGKVLTDTQLCGYPPSQVTVLTNQDANKSRILGALDTLAQRVQGDADATVIVFFAGHGTKNGDYYFLPYETQLTYNVLGNPSDIVYSTALSNTVFLEKVRQIEAKRLVILFNTCHAGGVGTTLSLESDPFAPVPLGLFDDLLTGSGKVILSSSQVTERSWGKGGAHNSIFVTHLLDALRGKGIKTEGKTINILDVFKHLSKAVPVDARTINPPQLQTPVMKAYDVTEDFPIALLLGGVGLSLDTAPPALPGTAKQFSRLLKLERAQKSELVNALLACPTMRDRHTRDVVVDNLPNNIKNSIVRNAADRVDVNNIVTRCADFAGGMEELVEVVRDFEGDSLPMQGVDAVWQHIQSA
ncbi:MAG: caspase family protein [Anaerolineae bacterium]|nr:caspase family protein [Anaerolineae bacterium]